MPSAMSRSTATYSPRRLSAEPSLPMALEFVPAVLSRSVASLRLLLEDDAVDLELASCIVALDPGLTFAVLQLANGGSSPFATPVWQLPSALVAVGREALQTLLQCAPRVESPGMARRRLTTLARNAVVRASIAQLLARELGCCNPRKSFLSGLLLETPDLVGSSYPHTAIDRNRLLAVMLASLPAPVVNAAMARKHAMKNVPEPLAAITMLSEVLRCKACNDVASDFVVAQYWCCWPEYTMIQRHALAERCAELALWAGENLYRLEPWDFLARLERRCPWELPDERACDR